MWTGTLRFEEGGKAEPLYRTHEEPAQRGGITSVGRETGARQATQSCTRTGRRSLCSEGTPDVQGTSCPVAPVRVGSCLPSTGPCRTLSDRSQYLPSTEHRMWGSVSGSCDRTEAGRGVGSTPVSLPPKHCVHHLFLLL